MQRPTSTEIPILNKSLHCDYAQTGLTVPIPEARTDGPDIQEARTDSVGNTVSRSKNAARNERPPPDFSSQTGKDHPDYPGINQVQDDLPAANQAFLPVSDPPLPSEDQRQSEEAKDDSTEDEDASTS